MEIGSAALLISFLVINIVYIVESLPAYLSFSERFHLENRDLTVMSATTKDYRKNENGPTNTGSNENVDNIITSMKEKLSEIEEDQKEIMRYVGQIEVLMDYHRLVHQPHEYVNDIRLTSLLSQRLNKLLELPTTSDNEHV
ncbi:uncharacterized protein [Apostichopus japonicus]|uniref:uncharacterized protein isoform X2 n=1 Tax=Stichopus japonicus TaxID=307972 RepID=UPI003AB20B40